MSTNTCQNNIVGPYRDKFREGSFYDAYGIDAKIEVTEFRDVNGNWDKCIVKFYVGDEHYSLIEEFNEGNDNNTKQVIREDNGKKNKNYDMFYDAEVELVNDLKEKGYGNSNKRSNFRSNRDNNKY